MEAFGKDLVTYLCPFFLRWLPWARLQANWLAQAWCACMCEVSVHTYVGCEVYVDKCVCACVFDMYIPVVCEYMYIWDALCLYTKISAVNILASLRLFFLYLISEL